MLQNSRPSFFGATLQETFLQKRHAGETFLRHKVLTSLEHLTVSAWRHKIAHVLQSVKTYKYTQANYICHAFAEYLIWQSLATTNTT